MSEVIIYHNPRCSKSRQTLALLEEHGVQPEIRKYLDDAPSADELTQVLAQLGLSARDLLRTKEPEFKENGLDDSALSEAQIINIMTKVPKLIERPIVIKGDKARIGRPPESVLDIL
ncbi:arsenate reductase (glutaredoxin) [Neptuniibacter pectenicola]|jgi:arsenate reductase|uniref:Arsenate reductase n=1 Tax=Neptuniibacter pectenicola TaxID=1806669 RepID=A0ABU9TVH2_9GAMM|nr:arsenate reductase (glutaredoxin) [Neptuniibacter pectenicola]KXJ56092.1 MAG: arsenate reductase [Neptuniibacter sp. Phe_28]|eukprot:gnl/Carplike_NY0171/15480_a23159_108.p1 GENE.gnl/Carplike_NY0171/15480_a23159_108~~gnl/Carplike_NY0171/15480_a23159_108.p1  ORF type:complete len:117 (-),score=11.18 gnl/Carplike_NY0171/15480_a23159_108:126-476(-)